MSVCIPSTASARCARVTKVIKTSVIRIHRVPSVVVKAGSKTPRSVEDVINEANQLLAAVENGQVPSTATSTPIVSDGVVCDEFGCTVRSPQANGVSSGPLAQSISGESWAINVQSTLSAAYQIEVHGQSWTVNLTTEELKDLLEAVLSIRNVVTNLHSQGDWHASLQSTAQWRVNSVLARASHADDIAGKAAFDMSIVLDPKGQRPVSVQWPSAAVAELLAALDAGLNPAAVRSAVSVTSP